MNILIGLSGKPRSGKDTIADYLVKYHGFKKYSFASYLKWVSHEYFDFPKEELWGTKTEGSRRFLQQMGKLLTDMDSGFFVDKVVQKIKVDHNEAEKDGEDFKVVISDVRRYDEIKLFDRSGTTFVAPTEILDSGIMISNIFDKILIARVDRDLETILLEEPGLKANINHPVEQLDKEFSDWDYLIDNNSDIDSLSRILDSMVIELEGDSKYDYHKGKDLR